MKTLTFDGRSPMQKQGMLSQLVIPRPIAMVTTIDPDGRLNVAPFSYFMPVCGEPPLIARTRSGTASAALAPAACPSPDTRTRSRESGATLWSLPCEVPAAIAKPPTSAAAVAARTAP